MRGISWTISAVALVVAAGAANAAQCGNTSAGFAQWKQDFTNEIKGRYGAAAISALASTNYNTATISADRNQSGFKLSFEQFMAKRGGAGIAARGKGMKGQAMFASIQSTYGVPPGPLLAIWGMETGFGAVRGNQNALSAVATLAYDCRRSAYFTDQLNAALTLVDRGVFSASTRGSMHGEVGHTQFLPKNVLQYGTGGSMDNAQTALASTANFLKGHGWRAGGGYQPGETNFGAIQAWNAAPVYQRAIAVIGKQIDGN